MSRYDDDNGFGGSLNRPGREALDREEASWQAYSSQCEAITQSKLQAEIYTLKIENAELHMECDRLTAMLTPKGTALSRFTDADGFTEDDPIERLRFFCSLAMDGQDWIDVEPFFGAVLTEMLGPQKVLGAEEVAEPGFYRWKFADHRWVIVIARYDDSKIVIKTILGDEIFIGKFIGPIKMTEVQG